MHRPSRLLAVCFFLVCIAFSAPVWAQVSPSAVYVSGGNTIFKVTNPGGAVSTLASDASATYEGLVVGPDNDAGDNSQMSPIRYLLYVCDPTNNKIIRLDPNNPPSGHGAGSAEETVYDGSGALQQPQCGRFDNTGDLIVTSKVKGSGFWVIPGVAGVAFHAGGFQTPVQNGPDETFSTTQANPQVTEGIAQGSVGALFIVDTANGEIIRDDYTSTFGGAPAFNSSPSCLIGPSKPTCTNATATLPTPFGVAKRSTGEIFVSNESKNGTNNVVQFNPQGGGGIACATFGGNNKGNPFFMQMSADNTLYVATTVNPNSGILYSIPTAVGAKGVTCGALTKISSALPALTGVALPPSMASITASNFVGPETFNFGFAAYQLTSPKPGCKTSVTVTAIPTNLAVVQDAIDNSSTIGVLDFANGGGTPAVNLGWDGFEIVFQVKGDNDPKCTPQFTDGTFIPLEFAQVDNLLVNNPRTIRCDDDNPPTGTSGCTVGQMWAVYPLGGVLPSDGGYGSHLPSGSTHYLANANLANAASGEPGTFCGFQSPLTNTPPPGIAGTFGSGQNLSLKFKLALNPAPGVPGNCQNGPFITDADALISVAQIAPVFLPNVAIDASGNSTPPPQPVFKNNPQNKQYEFSLSLTPKSSYPPGIYSLTITFLSNNETFKVAEIQIQ